MGYTPTIAECRLASVERAQITRQSALANNADSALHIIDTLMYNIAADLTTPLTNGKVRAKCNTYVSAIPPLVADYPDVNIGDEVKVLKIDSSVSASAVYDAERWIYTRGGFEKVLTAGQATSGPSAGYPTYTGTSNKLLDLRAIFSTAAGDNRVIYARAQYTGTTAQGEAGRFYAEGKSTITSIHGIHATGQVSAGGSIVGEIVGARVTLATATGLTLSGGTAYALRIDSDLVSAVTGLTACAAIGVIDGQTNKMPVLIHFDSSATGMIGATTAATAAGTIKVNHAGTIKYLQMYSSAS